MKAKAKRRIFQCQSCGFESTTWMGRCPDCNEWNSMTEERPMDSVRTGDRPGRIPRDRPSEPVPISSIPADEHPRTLSGLTEFDRVLGGGVVKGSVVLIGGDPGIGKSTLLLQVLARYAEQGHRVLYVTGEEALSQVKLRAERLGIRSDNLIVMAENELEAIVSATTKAEPQFLVVDSIQTLFSHEVSSAPGSVSQVRETAHALIQFVKSRGISLFIVGHVTKEGSIAGPKLLEHAVDAVVYFEGESYLNCRMLTTVKNRFGPTFEVGLFDMKETGLADVENPSDYLLSQTGANQAGAAVAAVMSGTRPMLVEIQALSVLSRFGAPRRTTTGFDPNKAAMLCAVLEKQMGWGFSERDLFVKVLGGIKFLDPGIDLAAVIAIASSYLEKPAPARAAFFGEIGLGGEIRPVQFMELRLREAVKMGFRSIFAPTLKELPPSFRELLEQAEVIQITRLAEGLGRIFA